MAQATIVAVLVDIIERRWRKARMCKKQLLQAALTYESNFRFSLMTSPRLLMLCEKVICVPATLTETISRSDPILVAVPRRTDSDLSGFNARQLWSNYS